MKEAMQSVKPGFGVDLEVVEVESREGNGINDKRKLKNQIFPFRMIMQKFRTIMQNAPESCNCCC